MGSAQKRDQDTCEKGALWRGMGGQQAVPTQVAWRWSRCHASFSHAGAESGDIAAAQAAAKLHHTRRKKSKRSRVGCRSVFSSPGSQCTQGQFGGVPVQKGGLQSSGLDCPPEEEC